MQMTMTKAEFDLAIQKAELDGAVKHMDAYRKGIELGYKLLEESHPDSPHTALAKNILDSLNDIINDIETVRNAL